MTYKHELLIERVKKKSILNLKKGDKKYINKLCLNYNEDAFFISEIRVLVSENIKSVAWVRNSCIF